jgi:N-dimethylarginine dimethylaminohydrolase
MPLERVLMCDPRYFDIEYVINPWMSTSNRVERRRAMAQWEALRDLLTARGVAVEVIEPAPGLPDMTFIGDAGIVHGTTFMRSRFRHEQRQAEAAIAARWMTDRGYRVVAPADDVYFEGLGDVVWADDEIVVGHGPRSSPESVALLTRTFPGLAIAGEVRLSDPWFYHTALALALLGRGAALHYPAALSPESVRFIESHFPHAIAVSRRDAMECMICNNIVVGDVVITHDCTPALERSLGRLGYEVVRCDASEFLKSGGSVRCLILPL